MRIIWLVLWIAGFAVIGMCSIKFVRPDLLFALLPWFGGLSADLYSTFRFYRKDRGCFKSNERHLPFALLAGRYGFIRAAAVFLIVFEFPMLLLSSAIVFVLVGGVPFVEVLPTAFILFGYAHASAAAFNFRMERSERHHG